MQRAMIFIQFFLLLLQFKSTESAYTAIEYANAVIVKPGCPETCEGSDIRIPYPFGVGQNCSLSDEFVVHCKNTTDGISPYRGLFMIENIDSTGQARTSLTIASSCGSTPPTTNFSNIAPFRLNTEDNKFVVVGCNTLAYLHLDNSTDYLAGCFSSCGSLDTLNNYGYPYGYSYGYPYRYSYGYPYRHRYPYGYYYQSFCSGIGCCQTDIPKGTSTFYATFDERLINNSKVHGSSQCSYAMVVVDAPAFQDQIYSTIRELANSKEPTNQTMPILLDWAIGNTTCEDAQTNKSSYACKSDHSVCLNSTSNSGGYLCNCLQGYEGNPYLNGGCQDIDECATEQNPCYKPAKCHNLQGTYRCSCPSGWSPNDHDQQCHRNCPSGWSRHNDDDQQCHLNLAIILGTAISLGFVTACSMIFLCIFIVKRINLIMKIKQEMLKKKFFDQNQGSLLQQLIASNEEATQNTRILTIQELKKATNGFDNALILGKGGHGYVYKGILSDQRVVAVKRSKIDDQANDERSVAQRAADRQVEINQFINEVVILSQVNHRNVVKLYGCCLETEVPLLVYEFISNGTLFNHLHVEEHCSLTWKHRLRIALEAAGAISYLHSSAASISVLHRDIKSSNILLDDYFTAKVSDFGISKSVQIDQTGIDTIIQGTLGYLDPEYHTTARLTQKSDVFSFGVILVELLTRKKPLFSSKMFEGGNLIGFFCDAMKENRLFEIIDPQLVNDEHKTELEAVAKLAELCLRLKGEERPTMKEVEVQLEVLWRSDQQQKHPLTSQSFEVRERRAHYSTLEIEQPQPSSKFFSAREGF